MVIYNQRMVIYINTYKPYEFAEMINVSVKTLQRWDNDKKLIAHRNPSNRRFYTHQQYIDYMNNSKVRQVIKEDVELC